MSPADPADPVYPAGHPETGREARAQVIDGDLRSNPALLPLGCLFLIGAALAGTQARRSGAARR